MACTLRLYNPSYELKTKLDTLSRYKKQLAHLASLIPYDQMTMEDYRDAFPEESLNPLEKPSFWPHLPEDQLGYQDKDVPTDSGH